MRGRRKSRMIKSHRLWNSFASIIRDKEKSTDVHWPRKMKMVKKKTNTINR